MQEYQEQSLSSQIFIRLRDDILSGTYSRGEELREISLGEKLGVSRTPIREALRQLELEGLVEIIPHKGAHVTGISQQDIDDIYQMRIRLEGLAARWAAQKMTDEEISELEEIILLSDFNLKKSKKEQMVRLDGKFHQMIYHAAGSRMLEHVLKDFHNYVKSARSTSVDAHDRATKSVEEHTAIFQAIKNRDGELAEQLANEHISHVIEHLRKTTQQIERKGYR